MFKKPKKLQYTEMWTVNMTISKHPEETTVEFSERLHDVFGGDIKSLNISQFLDYKNVH